MSGDYDALVLVSFGGPDGPADVWPFLQNVTRGRGVPADRLREVAAHYQAVGGVSPINEANRELLAALRRELHPMPVYWGNRNWHPLLAETVRQLTADGVRRALAFVTSAVGSYSGCRQYLEDIEQARQLAGPGAPRIEKLRLFYDHPGFIEPMADRMRAALARFDPAERPALLMSAHSIPEPMAAASGYVAQLDEVARLLVDRVAPNQEYHLVWQSRSGAPGSRWLEPDVGDRLAALHAAGTRAALVVPIGFVSDHLEVRHDLDTELAARAAALGVHLERAGTVGSDPRFVAMVGELVAERTSGAPARRLGRLEPAPDRCRPDCCRPSGQPGPPAGEVSRPPGAVSPPPPPPPH